MAFQNNSTHYTTKEKPNNPAHASPTFVPTLTFFNNLRHKLGDLSSWTKLVELELLSVALPFQNS